MQSPGIVEMAMIANDAFARIAILDPALSTIVPNIQHLGCVSNEFHKVLCEELCNQNEASPPPGPFQKDSVVWERLRVELCPSPCLPELLHFPKWIEKTKNFLCGRCILSICIASACISSILD